ncbi:MAG TPA: IS1380 family transposase [Ilumatobacteraceae bacterium]|nr:IS1380 family transposase [Ilumatobacteraceae bacterium]
MNRNSVMNVGVEAGGTQVVAHAGLHALGRFADRIGLGGSLSTAIPWAGQRAPLHDRGVVLTHAMLMLAGGGETCSDIEFLVPQQRLFGAVASDSTLYRTMRAITPSVLADLSAQAAVTRAQMWRRMSATTGTAMVVLDIDASLVQIHSENKAGTGPNYKGGFGFHPLLCFADTTGEALAGLLRPGNAGANSVADHFTVLDQAVAQLPAEIAVGHHAGDDVTAVRRAVQVRTDSAGCSTRFAAGCRARNIGFAVVARSNANIHKGISRIQDDNNRWLVARRRTGDSAQRSHVAEITDLVDLAGWPAGTRLIVRREHLHQGAQRSLFPSLQYRYWGHYTDNTGNPVELDAHMRDHAHVEDHIKRLKDSGLERFPFTDLDANRAWMQLVCLAADLVRWFQHLCCHGELATAEPKRLRSSLWHTPARIVRRAGRDIIRIIDGWPTTTSLLDAHQHITALC